MSTNKHTNHTHLKLAETSNAYINPNLHTSTLCTSMNENTMHIITPAAPNNPLTDPLSTLQLSPIESSSPKQILFPI